MIKSRLFAAILFGILFLLAACSSGGPSISVEETSLNLGDVTNGQIVSRDLIVRNDGQVDLVVNSVITSCSCTQATVEPMTIGANQSGTLHIEFDSGFHGPDLTGPLIRQVFIRTNDPQQPELQVELRMNVEAGDR